MNYENRTYVVIPSGLARNINFDEVLETSLNTLRYSNNGKFTFVKYDGPMPPSVAGIAQGQRSSFTYEQMLTEISKPEWSGSGVINGPNA